MRISDWSADVCSSDLVNGRVGDDDLRVATCFPHVFHTALSRAMRADALVQFLVWKKWTDLFLLAGDTAGDQAYAEAIHRAAKKFGAEIVAEESYAYDPIARRTDSGHIQVQRQMPMATQGAGRSAETPSALQSLMRIS